MLLLHLWYLRVSAELVRGSLVRKKGLEGITWRQSAYNHYVYCDIGWHCVQELTSVQAVLGAFVCRGVPIFV